MSAEVNLFGNNLPSKSCHNCRRRRLRCDRSLPRCFKCVKTGQECLGYQRLFLWDQGVASRGKMSGMTFEDMKRKSVAGLHTPCFNIDRRTSLASRLSATSPPYSLGDPLFHGLPYPHRYYLEYCESFLLLYLHQALV